MASSEPVALDFESASRLVLDYLSTNLPIALWSVTRVENGRQTFLYLNDGNGYQMVRGDSHPWQDSFCIHMAAGRTPAIAPDAQAIPEYASAGVNDTTTIGTYAGAAIHEADGEIFGAICGLDPAPHVDDVALAAAGPLLQFFGTLLTMALATDRSRDRMESALESATHASQTDALTGLANRRRWDMAVAVEEHRFARFADPTVVVIMDLDQLKYVNDSKGHAAGDDYIRTSADVLRASTKSNDVVARLGGDEFGILLCECTELQAVAVVDRIQEGLGSAGVSGSLGWSPITVLTSFPTALAEAEAAMYEMKAARKARRDGAM